MTTAHLAVVSGWCVGLFGKWDVMGPITHLNIDEDVPPLQPPETEQGEVAFRMLGPKCGRRTHVPLAFARTGGVKMGWRWGRGGVEMGWRWGGGGVEMGW